MKKSVLLLILFLAFSTSGFAKNPIIPNKGNGFAIVGVGVA